MEYPVLNQSVIDLWTNFVSADGLSTFYLFVGLVGIVAGVLITLLAVALSDIFEIVHAAVPLVKRSINERKAKKSGKLTTEQRFELLESKIDSIADIVISTSEEVK